MTTKYPDSIDNNITLPPSTDNLTPVAASVVNALRDAIVAVEKELGVKPSTIYGTVRARLDTLESIVTGGGGGTPGGPASGDLGLTYPAPKVIGIQGRPIASTAPSDGYILTWSATDGYWEPKSAPVGFSAGGDLSGSATSQQVISLTGATGLVSIPSASLEFGTHSSVAQSGLLRFGNIYNQNTVFVAARDTTNSIDIPLISGYGFLSDSVVFGGSAVSYAILSGNAYGAALAYTGSGASLTQSSSNTIQSHINTGFNVNTHTGAFTFDSDSNLTSWQFNLNAAQALGITGTQITIPVGSNLSFGTGAAHPTSGLIRLADVTGTAVNIMTGTIGSGGSDISIIQSNGFSGLIFGNTSFATNTLLAGTNGATLQSNSQTMAFRADVGGFFIAGGANTFEVVQTAGPWTFNSADASLTSWNFNINGAGPSLKIADGYVTLGKNSASTTAVAGNLLLTGSQNNHERTITSNYTIDSLGPDEVILANGSGALSITLPILTAGRKIAVKDISGNASTNNITILPNAFDSIDGYLSFTINVSYGAVSLISDGINWFTLGGSSVATSTSFAPLSISAGVTSTTNDNTSKLVIGACYFKPVVNFNYKVYFDCIIQTTSSGTTVNLDLFDVNGITNSGAPTVITGSLSSYSADSTLHHIKTEITSLESVTSSGIIEAELYTGAFGTSVNCYNAQIIYEPGLSKIPFTLASFASTSGPWRATSNTAIGTGFIAGVSLAVKINGVSCTGVTLLNSTHISFISPVFTANGGPYSVQVINGDGTTSNILTSYYTVLGDYLDIPSAKILFALDPATGINTIANTWTDVIHGNVFSAPTIVTDSSGINGQKRVVFAGSSGGANVNGLTCAGLTSSSTQAQAIAVARIASNGENVLWNNGSSIIGFAPFVDDSIYEGFGASARHDNIGTIIPPESFSYEIIADSSGNWSARLNGTGISSATGNTVSWPTGVNIGFNSANVAAYQLLGEVDFVMWLVTNLSSQEETMMRAYITRRWGLSA